MKHKKKQRTRKQKALCRGIVFAVFLGVALHFHLICLTPMQTIRATEFRMGLEPTEIVLSKDNLYLSESENVLMLSDHRPRLNVLVLPRPWPSWTNPIVLPSWLGAIFSQTTETTR